MRQARSTMHDSARVTKWSQRGKKAVTKEPPRYLLIGHVNVDRYTDMENFIHLHFPLCFLDGIRFTKLMKSDGRVVFQVFKLSRKLAI